MKNGNQNVEELDAAPPSVGSVIRKLYKYMDQISSISCVVTFEDGDVHPVGDYKDDIMWLRDATILRLYAEQHMVEHVMDLLDTEEDETE